MEIFLYKEKNDCGQSSINKLKQNISRINNPNYISMQYTKEYWDLIQNIYFVSF
jgi:archaellum component FlaG (FlaF/FlaG flagellin family)